MQFRMDRTLSFWVDCSYEDQRYENSNRTKADLIPLVKDVITAGDFYELSEGAQIIFT